MPRGGARIGAGRKPKDRSSALLTGARQRGPRGVVRPERPEASPAAAVGKPKTLGAAEAAIWDELAPLTGLLTAATAMAFADLCTFIVVERQLRLSALAAYGSDHRGIIKQIEILRARFRLVPDGKPTVKNDQPADDWAEFDGPTLVKGASA
jgi:hypothetical protein